MRPPRLTVVLVAHGSRDPRAGRATYALARAVGPAWDVRASFLDHAGPRPLEVLRSLAPGSTAVLVPLLLTSAYHGRVDVPAVVSAAADLPLRVLLAEVLGAGSPAALVDALTDRLATAVVAASTGPGSAVFAAPFAAPVVEPFVAPRDIIAENLDGVVLVAAGTRSAAARESIVTVTSALEARLGLPCAVAYASAAPPTAAEAVERLRAAGARRIGVASYFLAPGLLHDTAITSAMSAGAVLAAPPLEDHPDLVGLVRARVREALPTLLPAAA